MFSRFTKSVVKNLGHRKYNGGEENMKMTLFGTTRQINKTLTGSVKNGMKVKDSSSNPSRSRVSRLLMVKSEKSRSTNYSGSSNFPVSRIEKSSQRRFPMKNGILPYFPNRELDLERTLIELRDKELECSTRNVSTKNETNTYSEQRSITRFPLSEARVTGLMGVLSRLPTTATDSTALPGRQLAQTRSDELEHTPITSQACEATRVNCSGDRGTDWLKCERHENPCKKAERNNPCDNTAKKDPCKKKDKENKSSKDPCKKQEKENKTSKDPCRKNERENKTSEDSHKKKENFNPCGKTTKDSGKKREKENPCHSTAHDPCKKKEKSQGDPSKNKNPCK